MDRRADKRNVYLYNKDTRELANLEEYTYFSKTSGEQWVPVAFNIAEHFLDKLTELGFIEESEKKRVDILTKADLFLKGYDYHFGKVLDGEE